MDSFFITLTERKQLTHDVYELIYSDGGKHLPIPGQFLLCETDTTNPRLRRSYSISDYEGGNFHFIIKKLPDGKGGSQAICNQEIGHSMQVWGPTGGFVLPALSEEKIVFTGTGTGFAPLYFQAKRILETAPDTSVQFIFGVREEKDLFYQEILQEWSESYPNFAYKFCLSQGKENTYFQGRVTDYIRNNLVLIEGNKLYSICGNPAMVGETREILSAQGIGKEHIFFEQY